MLRSLVADQSVDAGLRLEVARDLSASHDEQGAAALKALALADAGRVPGASVAIRRAAANDLMSQGDLEGAKVLQQLARDYRLPRDERRQIAAELMERDDPVGRETLARLDREHAFRTARIQFGGWLLVLVPLVTLSARALTTNQAMTATVLVGLVGITIVAVRHLRIAPSLHDALSRLSRPSPFRPPPPLGRSSALEDLAEAVAKDLMYRQAVLGLRKQISTEIVSRHEPKSALHSKDLAEVFIRAPDSQILILGPPGSGKTQAATTLALDYIARRKEGNMVPVVFSLRSWSASDRSLEDWMIERTASDYAITIGEAESLVKNARILPVLDGLDVIPSEQLRFAMAAIKTMANRRNALVVTCRLREYSDLASELGMLDHSVIFEMQPLRPRDVIYYIKVNTTEEEFKAWTPIIRELEQASPGPFAELMANPLTATVALQPYLQTGRNPGQLLRQIYARGRSSADLDLNDVWRDYISNAISGISHYPPDKSMRWLRSLAGYMQDESDREFRWWKLRRFVPPPRMFALTLIAIAVLPSIAGITGARAVPLQSILVAASIVTGLLIISTQEPRRAPR